MFLASVWVSKYFTVYFYLHELTFMIIVVALFLFSLCRCPWCFVTTVPVLLPSALSITVSSLRWGRVSWRDQVRFLVLQKPDSDVSLVPNGVWQQQTAPATAARSRPPLPSSPNIHTQACRKPAHLCRKSPISLRVAPITCAGSLVQVSPFTTSSPIASGHSV